MKRLFSFVFAVLIVPLCVAAAEGPQLEVTEKPLCTIDFSAWEAKKHAHDPDLRHFAYATGDGTKEWIVIDGKEQPPYDRVTTPVFSAGGARVAYGAKRGDKCLMVIDGQAQPEFDLVDHAHFLFTPDGKGFVYPAANGKDFFLVGEGGQAKVVIPIDGDFGEVLGGYAELKFSPDGGRVALVVDNLEGRKAVFASDRKDLAALVQDDKVIGEPYEEISQLSFSLDGKRLAYVGNIGRMQTVVLDGKAGRQYHSITDMLFSPDGQHIAYIAHLSNPNATHPGKRVVVVDGKEVDDRFPSKLAYAPSGKLAYFTSTQPIINGQIALIIDGKSHPILDNGPTPEILVFGPNDHVAYEVRPGNGFGPSPVVDGVVGATYSMIEAFAFGPDGSAAACLASREGKPVLIVSGVESGPYDAIFGFRFDTPTSGHFLAKKGTTIYVVEVKVPAPQWGPAK